MTKITNFYLFIHYILFALKIFEIKKNYTKT